MLILSWPRSLKPPATPHALERSIKSNATATDLPLNYYVLVQRYLVRVSRQPVKLQKLHIPSGDKPDLIEAAQLRKDLVYRPDRSLAQAQIGLRWLVLFSDEMWMHVMHSLLVAFEVDLHPSLRIRPCRTSPVLGNQMIDIE